MFYNGLSTDDIIDRIYEASVVPTVWQDFLQRFVEVTEGRDAALIARVRDEYRWIGSSPSAEKLAFDHYTVAGGQERTRRLLSAKYAGFLSDFDVFSDDEMQTIPLFADYLKPRGYGRGVATAIPMPDGEFIVLHSEGDARLGRFSSELIARLDALRPHVARSAMLSVQLAFEMARTAVDTLSGLGFGACAVAHSGRVLVVNPQFEQEAETWTTRISNRIGLLDRRADRQLKETLGLINSHHGVRSIALAATATALPAVLHVVPIRRAAHDLFGQAAAILVLARPSLQPSANPGLLQALFDLSATEAGIAARIGVGRSISEIAMEDHKSVETVRNQLKSILAKTGCRRQPELASLLSRLLP